MNVKRWFTYLYQTKPCLYPSAVTTTSSTSTTTSSTSTMKELHFTEANGFAQASSVYTIRDGAKYRYCAANGFENAERPWRSKRWNASKPPMIWYQFRESYTPAKISFRPRQDSNDRANDSTPIHFQFVGANVPIDTNCTKSSDWKNICETADGARHECQAEAITATMWRSFQCLGLKILDVSGKRKAAALQGIKIWVRN